MCPFGSGSIGHTTINKIGVNKINCSTYILIYVITIGYCVFRATDGDMHVCSPAKDQDEKK